LYNTVLSRCEVCGLLGWFSALTKFICQQNRYVLIRLAQLRLWLFFGGKMIITNTETIPGREVSEILGMVRGNSVRAKHIGRDIMAGLKGIVGGEISGYTELLADAREESYKRMIKDAETLGADAILNVRFVTSMVAQTMSEMLAYGTAVKLK